MSRSTIIAGLSNPCRGEDGAQFLKDAKKDNYDFISVKLPHSTSPSSSNGTMRTDITDMESRHWSTSTVGYVSDPPTIIDPSGTVNVSDLDMDMKDVSSQQASLLSPSSPNNTMNYGEKLIEHLSLPSENPLRKRAEETLLFMLNWASHMNIPAIILPPVPTNENDIDANGTSTSSSSKAKRQEYARFLASQCLKTNVQIWIRVPCNKKSIQAYTLLHKMCDGAANLGCMLMFTGGSGDGGSSSSGISTSSSVTVDTLPQNIVLLHQLIGSNLRAICYETSVFLRNKRGFPTLSKSHQILFTTLLQRLGRTIRVMVEGSIPLSMTAQTSSEGVVMGVTGCSAYLQYLRHLRGKEDVTSILDTEESEMELPYLDSLQSPLQPLGDDLEFCTYETFERDPVKYEQYRIAVELALQDKITKGELPTENMGSMNVGEANDIIHRVNILVVGAGRGPLVQASLDAVKNMNETVGESNKPPIVLCRVVALEKNQSAVLYLLSKKQSDPLWSQNVEVVQADMRKADTVMSEGTKFDIVVSELLGSFGDNELSPECLDGLQRTGFLKSNCVSIPQRYTSYLAPITSNRLHSEAQAQAYSPSNPAEGPSGKPSGTLQAMETPYVVRTHAASQTHLELPCWEFYHPLTDKQTGECTPALANNVNNEREKVLLFVPDSSHGAGTGSGYGPFDSSIATIAQISSGDDNKQQLDGGGGGGGETQANKALIGQTIHGFLGTFHCVLYEKTTGDQQMSVISTAPTSFSTGMFSWFPLYFPLREPMYLPVGASLECSIWRKTDSLDSSEGGGKVWYEWCAEVLSGEEVLNVSPVHNPNGRSSFVRL